MKLDCSPMMTLSPAIIKHGRLMHYIDVIMTAMASQITSLTVVYSIVYSGADQRKQQSSTSLAFVGEFIGTGEFPAQRASNAEIVSIWWRHHITKMSQIASADIITPSNLCNSCETIYSENHVIICQGSPQRNQRFDTLCSPIDTCC